jgi:uncharacterized protein
MGGIPGERLGPIRQDQRVASLDVLRGVAILGILVINVQSFSMIYVAYLNPTAFGDLTGWSYAVWLFSHIFFDREFLEVFSILFGAGMVMMTARCDAAGRGSAGMHYRRMILLLVIGLFHAHLLWHGDILYSYALCGMIVFSLRRCQPRLLILLGTLLIIIPSVFLVLWHAIIPYVDAWSMETFLNDFQPPPEAVAKEVAAYRGGWLKQMEYRTGLALLLETGGFLWEPLWRASGMMCIGMGLIKLNVLTATRSSKTYLWMLIIGLLTGIPLTLYGVHANSLVGWDGRYSSNMGVVPGYWGSLGLVFAWIGAVMLVCRHNIAVRLQRRLAAIGQLALSNYLLQTVIGTTIFYGHGLGLFGRVERTEQFLIVLAVWFFQLWLSPLWLRYFQFGPVEWLWRMVTYLKLPPMRRRRTG